MSNITPQSYKVFDMLNSNEYDNSTAHKKPNSNK